MKKPAKILTTAMIMLFSLVQMPLTQAAMITTGEAIQAQQRNIDRDNLLSMLQKDELRAQLAAYGVDAQAAAERISHMTDAEIAMLNDHLDEMPAGESFLSVIGLIVVVLVVTDLIGATDVFPFIRPVS
ncbi:DUF6627 family protein [Photobacterium atrarenae]|uniref:PA2779 family protein n=1 Tax=Photobacterium atrarenae TaxID=865757 RepID=A0ABY5GNY6_9GAMM|nr:DUF6627 family protein [Photobacterium atrarenae]UTV30520.1 PA2779 family protein [Photobacterium atrarenae]